MIDPGLSRFCDSREDFRDTAMTDVSHGFVYSADRWRTSGTEEERLREGPAQQRRPIQFESKDRGALTENKNYILVNFIHFGTQTMRHTSRTQELPLSSASTLDDQRWAAFVARDASRDG